MAWEDEVDRERIPDSYIDLFNICMFLVAYKVIQDVFLSSVQRSGLVMLL